jgi:hypothetical protein
VSAEVRRDLQPDPFFSICVPQHNRTSFLLEALRSLAGQTFRSFEVCISDDCSTDGRGGEVVELLQDRGLSFVYRRRETNGRYDANLRSALALARGRYAFLLGNDDALAGPDTLGLLHAELSRLGPVGLAITNYEEYDGGRRFERAPSTGLLGSGPAAAVALFRSLSFVSGLVLDTRAAQGRASAEWDGSEMYQVLVACRLVAGGWPAAAVRLVTIRKDIKLPGERVASYATGPREATPLLAGRDLPLAQLGRLVASAVAPEAPPGERAGLEERAVAQVLAYPYPYWILEYRRVRSWRYALSVCLGMTPRRVTAGLRLGWRGRLRLGALYAAVTAAGLLTPLAVFDRLYPALYALAKRSPAA